jgi:serine/threonine protein kinase
MSVTKRAGIGTSAWIAPEVRDFEFTSFSYLENNRTQIWDEAEYDEKSDIYSLAMVFYELITNRIPWDGLREQQIMKAILMVSSVFLRDPFRADFLFFIFFLFSPLFLTETNRTKSARNCQGQASECRQSCSNSPSNAGARTQPTDQRLHTSSILCTRSVPSLADPPMRCQRFAFFLLLAILQQR